MTDERTELRGAVLEGGYQIGTTLGSGGTGVVFSATRLSDGGNFVVKTLRPSYAFHADLVRRLRREAEVARRVGHPALVPVIDEGLLPDGSPFLVMQRVYGESLNQVLRREGTLDIESTLVIVRRVADALHRAHAFGYVHRDVKPEHIILSRGPEGSLKTFLLDFGVCASATAPTDERERERGRVFGTPSYCSPEQASGDPEVDPRADVFALGIVAYECLTGRVPFFGDSVTALLRNIIRADAPPLRESGCKTTPALEEMIRRMLARDKDDRFATARAVGRALSGILTAEGAAQAERRLVGPAQSGHFGLANITTVDQTAAA